MVDAVCIIYVSVLSGPFVLQQQQQVKHIRPVILGECIIKDAADGPRLSSVGADVDVCFSLRLHYSARVCVCGMCALAFHTYP